MPLKSGSSGRMARFSIYGLLFGAAVASFALAGGVPRDGLHFFPLMASVLPLQLAAFLYVLFVTKTNDARSRD